MYLIRNLSQICLAFTRRIYFTLIHPQDLNIRPLLYFTFFNNPREKYFCCFPIVFKTQMTKSFDQILINFWQFFGPLIIENICKVISVYYDPGKYCESKQDSLFFQKIYFQNTFMFHRIWKYKIFKTVESKKWVNITKKKHLGQRITHLFSSLNDGICNVWRLSRH